MINRGIFVSREKWSGFILVKQVCKCFIWVTNLGTIHRRVLPIVFLAQIDYESWGISLFMMKSPWRAFKHNNTKPTKTRTNQLFWGKFSNLNASCNLTNSPLCLPFEDFNEDAIMSLGNPLVFECWAPDLSLRKLRIGKMITAYLISYSYHSLLFVDRLTAVVHRKGQGCQRLLQLRINLPGEWIMCM